MQDPTRPRASTSPNCSARSNPKLHMAVAAVPTQPDVRYKAQVTARLSWGQCRIAQYPASGAKSMQPAPPGGDLRIDMPRSETLHLMPQSHGGQLAKDPRRVYLHGLVADFPEHDHGHKQRTRH